MPDLAEYYHGYIDRTEAEKRLKQYGIPNCYLLRLSRAARDNENWDTIYVLSYLSSDLVCYHFKLIPRLNCFQLGGRLFDCLEGCLSRYYVRDIMTGERLRHPVPPCTPPVEFHLQKLRAIQSFEPEDAHDRLGCAIGDRFLLVSEDPNSDWVLATSLKTRHSGYLPKCCVEKEYPKLIERLNYFHPDSSGLQPKELLKKAGPFSYLLRPCDSRPGQYTLLLYDGVRVRKYRLEMAEELPNMGDVDSKKDDDLLVAAQRRSSEPTNGSTHTSDSADSSVDMDGDKPTTQRRRSGDVPVPNSGVHVPVVPQYRTVTKVVYNKVPFPSVEAVVAAIEANPGPWHPDSQKNGHGANGDIPLVPDGNTVSSAEHHTRSPDETLHDAEVPVDFAEMDGTPRIFHPVLRELKPQPNPPSSAIYMALRYTRQLPSQHAALEIHGELSMFVSQRKKWRMYYAQLDRRQGILTLQDGEKHKTERFDLSKCDYYPVHCRMYDREHCFGLAFCGASPGDREELVFSVDPQLPSVALSGRLNGAPSNECDIYAYAGRPDDLVQPAPPADRLGRTRSGCDLSSNALDVPVTQHLNTSLNISSGNVTSPKTVFNRWVQSVRRYCRNTKLDASNEEDMTRRQTQLRCYRLLELKISCAKLVPSNLAKSRRDDPLYTVLLDGIEIARAYSGSAPVDIVFDEFPNGFKKVEILTREENKKKRSVTVDLELPQYTSDSSAGADRCHSVFNAEVRPIQSSICTVQERGSSQATIAYKELHVLPFTHYELFRQVIRNSLNSEVVPLCTYVYKHLSQETSKLTFVSSLLLVTTELKCHLRLMVSLLRNDITADNPSYSFRGNSLGAQILDLYSCAVCTDWRNQCFKRVREEAMNGPPLNTLSSSTTSLSSSSITPSGSSQSSALSSARPVGSGCLSRATATGRPYSLSTVTSPSNVEQSPSDNAPGSCFVPASQLRTKEQEWYSRLVAITVEDLVNYVRQFPLQVRWVYSELQAMHTDQKNNMLVCNLVFLRGLCPSLCPSRSSTSGPSNCNFLGISGLNSSSVTGGSGNMYEPSSLSLSSSSAQSSGGNSSASGTGLSDSSASSDALIVVAKTLLALVSPNVSSKVHSDNILTPEQFIAYRSKLLKEFRGPITSPLSATEVKQLEYLYETEAYRASTTSLSRQLAQLSSYFIDALSPVACPTNPGASQSRHFGNGGSSLLVSDYRCCETSPPPSCPSLFSVLHDLNQKTRQYLCSQTKQACLTRN
ncbi:unnamed protein product [Calicophoron daubneyi]|uniref:SH2 domain-containing protein n=1 Tax=Calicophoron daubneyi TaxID=300641 RepID=A0AAV2TKJ5_CALDB